MLTSEERLIAIIQNRVGRHLRVSPQSSIAMDLGLDGSDACELIAEIANEFNVDFSDIDSQYFNDDFILSVGFAFLLLSPVVWPMMFLLGKVKKKELFVSDLLDAVDRGYWLAPDRPALFPWQRKRISYK
ncbi:MAG: DUF1493 family protein [Cyanobacteria bacterium SZAS TMP-1]|nr:DUF1493 family protein [Cyanobacteria bacterium SZAS TMP-1]